MLTSVASKSLAFRARISLSRNYKVHILFRKLDRISLDQTCKALNFLGVVYPAMVYSA
jgi:hypothetical protein